MAKQDKPHGKLADHFGLAAYKFVCFILKILDVRLVAIAGRVAGYIVWAVTPRRRRIVARNLRIVVSPTLRPNKLAPMVRRNIVRTIMNLACSMKTGLMRDKEAARSIRMEGAEEFERCGSGGHTVISCIPHAGNWEILARIRPYFSRVPHFGSMYRRLSNPLLEDFVYQSRTRYGCKMYSKEDGIREVLKVARSGGLLGVLSDQFTREGVYVPYFGKVTGTTPLPALIYKRCKDKGHLFSVFTRNTALGKWEAVLGREIHLPEGCTSPAAITLHVNLALEKCQNENILDGFWMHHRWKTTRELAPEMDEETIAAIREHIRLPFRMIINMPAQQEAALEAEKATHMLAHCRPDAELTILCTEAQADYWRARTHIAHVLTTDGAVSIAKQFDAEEVYKNGPFDALFMFGDDAELFKRLQPLFPLYVIGWEDHTLASKYNDRYRRQKGAIGHPSAAEYIRNLKGFHGI